MPGKENDGKNKRARIKEEAPSTPPRQPRQTPLVPPDIRETRRAAQERQQQLRSLPPLEYDSDEESDNENGNHRGPHGHR